MLALLKNMPLIAAALAFFFAQMIKVVIYRDLRVFGRYGGMPSAHVATVSALAWATGRVTGFDSPITAVAGILLSVVAADAVGLRRKVDPNSGHTLMEAVVGFALGMLVAYLLPVKSN
ncbi:divergent PAP2 family protein [Thermosipho ferrireducens]|nr:divergent PAP2 family protein [Thermosipho ferrireducens]